jgi:GNAT superfamily N-acetyltransferase
MLRAEQSPAVGSLSLRRGRSADADLLHSIHRESALAAYAHIFPPERYPFPDEEMRAHWVAELGDGEATTVIAESDGVGIGFVVVSRGWLRSLFVRASEWGGGAGSALHDEAVELLRAEGAGASLWVLGENEQARVFYEHRGWRHDGERDLSPYPPYPPVLRYVLDLGGAEDPIPNPHPPMGNSRLPRRVQRPRADFEPRV